MTYVQCMQENQPFIDQTWEKIETKLPHSLAAAQGLDFIPYTTRGRKWEPAPFDGVSWWTNGFWPGLMWQMHLRTGEARYRQEAERAEEMLDQALEEFDHLHHDVGFMWLISAGANYRITGNPRMERRQDWLGDHRLHDEPEPVVLGQRGDGRSTVPAYGHGPCGYRHGAFCPPGRLGGAYRML